MTQKVHQEISKVNPRAIVLLIDQSRSMSETFVQDPGRTKAQIAADAINSLLLAIVGICTRGENDIRDDFYVGVIGYGGDPEAISPSFATLCDTTVLVPAGVLAANVMRVESREVALPDETTAIRKHPIWLDLVAEGGAQMCGAIRCAYEVTGGGLSITPPDTRLS